MSAIALRSSWVASADSNRNRTTFERPHDSQGLAVAFPSRARVARVSATSRAIVDGTTPIQLSAKSFVSGFEIRELRLAATAPARDVFVGSFAPRMLYGTHAYS